MMTVEGRLVGRTCMIGNTVMLPQTSPAYVLVTNDGHTVSHLSGQPLVVIDGLLTSVQHAGICRSGLTITAILTSVFLTV